MEGFWSGQLLQVLGFLLVGVVNLTGPWTTVSAESAASSSSLTLSFNPLDLEGILTIVFVSLWGLVILAVVSVLLYALIRHCISARNETSPIDGDDTEHPNQKNEISTYYVYINPEDSHNTDQSIDRNTYPNTGNRTSSTVGISVKTYGAISLVP